MELSQLADVRMGYPFRSRLEHEPEGDVTVIQMKDIDDANLLHPEQTIRVSLPSGKDRHLIRPGDLLFRSRGRTNGAALISGDIGPAVLAAPMLLIRSHDIHPDYLCWFINTPATQAQLHAMAEGTSVRMISAEALRTLDVPVPDLATQRRIVEIDALAQREQSLLSRIANHRQQLISRVLLQHATEGTS